MPNLLLQHWEGEPGEIERLSFEAMESYAEQVRADYKLLRGFPWNPDTSMESQKMAILNEEWDDYDQVCIVDSDMFPRKRLKRNLFSEQGAGVYQPRARRRLLRNHPSLISKHKPFWGGAIHKLTREERIAFRNEIPGRSEEIGTLDFHRSDGRDESIMNFLLCQTDLHPAYLHERWSCGNYFPDRRQAAFLHIRKKFTQDGVSRPLSGSTHLPRREKIENYHQMQREGLL